MKEITDSQGEHKSSQDLFVESKGDLSMDMQEYCRITMISQDTVSRSGCKNTGKIPGGGQMR